MAPTTFTKLIPTNPVARRQEVLARAAEVRQGWSPIEREERRRGLPPDSPLQGLWNFHLGIARDVVRNDRRSAVKRKQVVA